jgi:hypothetical protein
MVYNAQNYWDLGLRQSSISLKRVFLNSLAFRIPDGGKVRKHNNSENLVMS